MKNSQDIEENEIRVIGKAPSGGKKMPPHLWWILGAVLVVILLILFFVLKPKKEEPTIVTIPGTENEVSSSEQWLNNINDQLPPCTVMEETMIDSIHLQIYTPYNVVPELRVNWMDTGDNDIVFAHWAADIRRDNGKIVGAFVNKGEPLSWGLSKKGYCAVIDGKLTLGLSENSPLFEQATGKDGYFFRQYPSVSKGVAISNNPQNASYRRALCVLNGKVCIIGCSDRVLMNDFSIALVKLGVNDAIFLVGSTAYGWWRDSEGRLSSIGTRPSGKKAKKMKYMNYIVFRKQ